ncbi:MAG: T9SS type A sorting domain-containing protein, partial [Ignavibacteriaceae bacterium]
TNGGLSWEQAEIDTSLFAFFPVLNIAFYNSNYGYACGGAIDGAGVVWSTTNGGYNWFAIDPSDAPPDPISQVHIFDSLNVIGIGGDRELFGVGVIRTSDGGSFWDYEDIGMQGFGMTLDFRTENEAWSALGSQQKFIYSIDSGTTWIQIPTPDSSEIFDVIFPDSLHGFAVGREGTILKYKPPIVDAVSEYRGVTPESFVLFQNYPNPFNPNTIIKYSLPEEGFVNLTVFNMLGEEIITLVNNLQKSGNYEVEFNSTNLPAGRQGLPSGIYFYRFQTGSFRETKKMVILK